MNRRAGAQSDPSAELRFFVGRIFYAEPEGHFGGKCSGLICIFALLVSVGFSAQTPLQAQSCHSDVQCNGGLMRSQCAGNTLVTSRSVCAGGQCQTVETSRVSCGNTCLADRCIDGTPGPKRDTDAASPARCLVACSCRNNRLVVVTGRWSVHAGCEQRVKQCARGCVCDDKPRCL